MITKSVIPATTWKSHASSRYFTVFFALISLFLILGACSQKNTIQKSALNFQYMPESDFLVSDNDIILMDNQGTLRRISYPELKEKWAVNFNQIEEIKTLQLTGNMIYLAGEINNSTHFWLINPGNGKINFKYNFKYSNANADPAYSDNNFYFIPETFAIEILQINTVDSTLLKYTINGLKYAEDFPDNLVVYNNLLYSSVSNKGIIEINASTRETLDIYKLNLDKIGMRRNNMVTNGKLLVTGPNSVDLFNLETKKTDYHGKHWDIFDKKYSSRNGINSQGDEMIILSYQNDSCWFLNTSKSEEILFINKSTRHPQWIGLNKNLCAVSCTDNFSHSKTNITLLNIDNGSIVKKIKKTDKEVSPIKAYKNGFIFINNKNEICLTE